MFFFAYFGKKEEDTFKISHCQYPISCQPGQGQGQVSGAKVTLEKLFGNGMRPTI